MDSSTELILLNRDRFLDKSLLVIGCPDVSSAYALASDLGAKRVSFLHRDYSIHSRTSKPLSGKSHQEFGVWLHDDTPSIDTVLLYIPKGKELLEMILTAIATLAASEVYLVGTKRSGIESAKKVMSSLLGDCRKLKSARHASLLVTHRTEKPATKFSIADFQDRWSVDLGESSMPVISLPGVFSHGRLDEGTRRLLACFDHTWTGRILDVGCGCGVIGATIANGALFTKGSPNTTVEMIDSDALAIMSSKATIEANGLTNARCYPSDLFSNVDSVFDVIVSNPPFHRGNATDRRMMTEITSHSVRHLKPDGQLVIVANRFLPYGRTLARHFLKVRTLYEDGRYCVYSATGPIALHT